MLTLGTGLGIGFVANGMFETKLPYYHMGGHLSIKRSGSRCYCGKQGCLESLVSATGIINSAIALGWKIKYPNLSLTPQNIFMAEQKRDVEASIIVKRFLLDLKTGIDNYTNLFALDIIIIGGGVSEGIKPYLKKFNKNEFLKTIRNYKVEIALSEINENSGILGSASLFNT